jgi:hypothetical protein
MMAGKQNDNTIFTCMRLFQKDDSYERQVPYIESLNGQHSQIQAIRLKQLYNDFEADYVVMDTAGNGISLYDDCARVLYDQERDEEYPAWCAFNNENMKNRALDQNALPIIFSVKINDRQLNHQIATGFKNTLQKSKISFLMSELEAKSYLSEQHDYDKKSAEDKAKMLKPFIQTTALINEAINLEYEVNGGFIKVHEIGSNRKDRYSSASYGNYFANILEENLRGENDDYDPEDEYVLY